MGNWFSKIFDEPDKQKPSDGDPPPQRPQTAPAWAAGKVILDDYMIEKELGRGGMGRVWLVKSNSTGRRFAVKQTILKDEKSRKAFLAELQTWIDLPEHPNIVPCRFFRTVDDEIVIFTDYVDGGSLKDWIDQGKLTTLEQILDVAIQFAWGLHAIHERGLIHQDVKPGNVLMTADGVPMVADFGLARARQVAPDGQFVSPVLPLGQQSVLVSVGGMTPAYASPEQKAGQPLSRKTDIWSWGVSVLDMFMGGVSCPHGGHIAADVLQAFLDNGGQESELPEMPREVGDILRKCLAIDLTSRWANLYEVTKALIEVIQATSRQPYRRQLNPMVQPNTNPFQHDRRISGVKWRDPREWLRDAYVALKRDPKEAEAWEPPIAYSRRGAGVADLAVYEEAERLFLQASHSGSTNVSESIYLLNMHRALLCKSLEDSTGALQSYGKCIALCMQHRGDSEWHEIDAKLAHALMDKAGTLGDLGDKQGAVALYDQAIEITIHLVNVEGRREFANSLASLYKEKAIEVGYLGDHRLAVELYNQAIEIRERLVNVDGQSELANDLAELYMAKGNVVGDMGDAKSAVAMYDRAIEIREPLVNVEGRNELANSLASLYLNKALEVWHLGDAQPALVLFDQAIEIREQLVNVEGQHEFANGLATLFMSKAVVLDALGDRQAAVELYDEAIEIREQLVNVEGRCDLADDLARLYMNKALAVGSLGDNGAALSLFVQAIKIRERLVNVNGRSDLANDLAILYMNTACAANNLGANGGAVELYNRAIDIREWLVKVEGRQELIGDLARSKALVLISLGEIEKGRREGHDAITMLRTEVNRTGRVDLKAVLDWTMKELGEQ